jgi:phasin family protein
MNATLNVEQILAANKNAVAEAQNIAATAFAGFEKLVALNMATTKSALFENNSDMLSTFSMKNPADMFTTPTALVTPMAEQAVAYGRSVYAIASETSAELSMVAEEKAAEAQKAFHSAVENMAKNAPAGSETLVSVIKTAVTAGQNAIDSAKSSAKKAMQVAEQQATTMTDTAFKTVKTPSRKK